MLLRAGMHDTAKGRLLGPMDYWWTRGLGLIPGSLGLLLSCFTFTEIIDWHNKNPARLQAPGGQQSN